MDEKDRDRREARRERPERTESEERRRRERRKEREERHRREKEKVRNGASSGGKLKKPTGLDIIDKLDVTGIYGQGRKCKARVRHNRGGPLTAYSLPP